jgi:hypothetical protein
VSASESAHRGIVGAIPVQPEGAAFVAETCASVE